MKNYNSSIKIIFLLVLFCFTVSGFAQSDYEIVRDFKQKYQQLADSINSAKSLEELNSIVADIDRFRDDFIDHKVLLDKSLYPDDFDKSFDKLNLAFIIRNQDFAFIDMLQTENLQLKEQVELLNKRNTELMNKVQEFEYAGKNDRNKLTELEKLVAELKSSLRKRDELIYSIVDSLMPQLMKTNTLLSNEERGRVYLEAERINLISNVKRSLQDNIKFLKVTSLLADDITKIMEQQSEFFDFWQDAGVKLVDIYAEKNERSEEIREIDSLFNNWQYSMKLEAWSNIRNEFSFHNITLSEFTNGNEFTEVLISFMEEEIKSIGVKSPEEIENTYSLFADSTWFTVIKPIWIPFLEENEMLSEEQKVEIENKISDWKGRLTPASFDWIYVLVAIIAVAGIGFMNRKRLFRNNKVAE